MRGFARAILRRSERAPARSSPGESSDDERVARGQRFVIASPRSGNEPSSSNDRRRGVSFAAASKRQKGLPLPAK